MNELAAYISGIEQKKVGELRLDERRLFVFQYDSEWLSAANAFPISLSLPLSAEPYSDDESRPFFANLLPEAGVRDAVARKLGISPRNEFALLEALGGECAGSVSLLPIDSTANPPEGNYKPLTDESLDEILDTLPRRPLLAGEEGMRLSLAGAQDKLPVYIEGDQILLPTDGAPSSHILKPPIRGVDGSVYNESFCMTLASRLGLKVPKVWIRSGKTDVLVVERYDRKRSEGGRLVRIHQEDFCQALGIPPDIKYEAEGGPSLAACFSLLKKHGASPAADKKALLEWVIFNYLIGNADGHAKNVSLLYEGKRIRLAPFYDLLCTAVYEGLTDKFAMKIGGENRPEWIQKRHWERLAEAAEIKPKLVLGILKILAEMIVDAAEKVAGKVKEKHGDVAIVREVLHIVRDRSQSALTALSA